MSRLHMMMHDLHSKGHLTVKVIEGQTVFIHIWTFMNHATKWSYICTKPYISMIWLCQDCACDAIATQKVKRHDERSMSHVNVL